MPNWESGALKRNHLSCGVALLEEIVYHLAQSVDRTIWMVNRRHISQSRIGYTGRSRDYALLIITEGKWTYFKSSSLNYRHIDGLVVQPPIICGHLLKDSDTLAPYELISIVKGKVSLYPCIEYLMAHNLLLNAGPRTRRCFRQVSPFSATRFIPHCLSDVRISPRFKSPSINEKNNTH